MNELPPFDRAALLLDLDGTLIDIAAAPDLVVVPPGLCDTLRTLRHEVGDALAIVTGRSIETIDHLLGDVPYAVAAEHGGAIRHAPGAPVERPNLPAPPKAWLDAAAGLADAHPGAILERKARGFSLHYRAVPKAELEFHHALTALLVGSEEFELLPAHMLWEVRPRGADKGMAVTSLMSRPPFLGKLPVFIGDDVTDEAAIVVANAIGGAGYRVADRFGDAAGVRSWLHATAAAGNWEQR